MKVEFGVDLTFERQLEITDFIRVKCIINVYAKMLTQNVHRAIHFRLCLKATKCVYALLFFILASLPIYPLVSLINF